MIISHARRYVFVHIPKTGGTALALALEARAAADDLLIGDTPKARRRRGRLDGLAAAGRLWKHSTLSDIIGILNPAELQGYFVFTMVRNPWDRMVSYYFWLRSQSFAHPAVVLAKGCSFSEFLNAPQTQASIAAAPYGSYVRLPDGSARCDLFIRLEHFAQDIAPLEAHLGFALPPLARVNASKRSPDWRGYYSAADADRVAALCAADIARFGYGF